MRTVRFGVIAAVGLVPLLLVTSVPARDVAPRESLRDTLRLEAARRGIIPSEEAFAAYELSGQRVGGYPGASGAIAGGIIGGAMSGAIVRGAGRPGNRSGPDGDPRTGRGEVTDPIGRAEQASAVGFLDSLANIRVRVRPAPPRDYVVMINGRPYPASELSVYAIPPGIVSISVERRGRSPCQWSGAVDTGRDKLLDCRM